MRFLRVFKFVGNHVSNLVFDLVKLGFEAKGKIEFQDLVRFSDPFISVERSRSQVAT